MHTKWDPRLLEAILADHAGRRGSLLPILHEVQDSFGHVPADAVPLIAEALNLSRAEVHGTISFYHDFRSEPAAKPVIKLCRAEACQARGVEQLAPLFETDGRVEVETVYCLGLCASGPSAMVGHEVFARLDEESAKRLIDRAAVA
jgi:formate dehydrogenase subunit gamma